MRVAGAAGEGDEVVGGAGVDGGGGAVDVEVVGFEVCEEPARVVGDGRGAEGEEGEGEFEEVEEDLDGEDWE
uniref:Uncharacterized protein n=1 Tax=Arcella intermedia TaxID=1963864 RepID=A0A6B2LXN5_9EUKA